jgi:hypothetical protein
MRVFVGLFSVVSAFSLTSLSAEIRNGLLHDPSLASPVSLVSIEKTEFHFDRIDEALALNAQELEYIRLRNDEELWIKSKRYAVVGAQRIPITLDQEFQILTAKIRGGAPVSAQPLNAEAREVQAATNSLQIESIERANSEIVSNLRSRLAAFESKTFATTSKVKEFNRESVPKSLSLWRAIIDNQNIFLEHTNDGPVIVPSQRTVRVSLRDPLTCNLSTVKPAAAPGLLFFELRNGSTTYWAQTYNISFDAMLKTFITATPGGQTLCFNDRIMSSSFEDGEFGPR